MDAPCTASTTGGTRMCAGVVGQGAEPNIARPGTVDWPNPSAQLLEKVPIAKVTHDGDVTQNSVESAPAENMPRN
jgi:hypothetical protein